MEPVKTTVLQQTLGLPLSTGGHLALGAAVRVDQAASSVFASFGKLLAEGASTTWKAIVSVSVVKSLFVLISSIWNRLFGSCFGKNDKEEASDNLSNTGSRTSSFSSEVSDAEFMREDVLINDEVLINLAKTGDLAGVSNFLKQSPNISDKARADASQQATGKDRWNIRKALVVEGRKIKANSVEELNELKHLYLECSKQKELATKASNSAEIAKFTKELESLTEIANHFSEHWYIDLAAREEFLVAAESEGCIDAFKDLLKIEAVEEIPDERLVRSLAEIAARHNYTQILTDLLKNFTPAKKIELCSRILRLLLCTGNTVLKKFCPKETSENLANAAIFVSKQIIKGLPTDEHVQIIVDFLTEHNNNPRSIYSSQDRVKIWEGLVPLELEGAPLAALLIKLEALEKPFLGLTQGLLSKRPVAQRLDLVTFVLNSPNYLNSPEGQRLLDALMNSFNCQEMDQLIQDLQKPESNDKLKGHCIKFLSHKTKVAHNSQQVAKYLAQLLELEGGATLRGDRLRKSNTAEIIREMKKESAQAVLDVMTNSEYAARGSAEESLDKLLRKVIKP